MKVLFIVPPFGFRKEGEKIKQKKGFMPPIGVALLATLLDGVGHEVRILDMQIDQLTEHELIDYVKEYNPSFVCLAMLDATATLVHKIFHVLKSSLPSLITVAGGVHASMYPKKVLEENKDIDYIAVGEAEYTLRDLVHALEEKEDLKNVKGLYLRENSEIISTGYRPVVQDLDEFPIPLRKFFNLNKYIPTPNQYKRMPATNMVTARGCTYSLCTFCFESTDYVREKGYRRVSVQRAIEEIQYLQKEYGIREIVFWDDEFLMGGDWVEAFCDALIAQKIDLVWSCYGKVNFVKPERMKKMRKAGCWNIFFGLESGNQELLNFMKKGQTLDMMKNAVKWAHDAGIEVRGSFILGLPLETPEMGQKTVDFALSLDLDYGQFNLTTPFTGTEMYEACRSGKYGTFNGEEDFDKYTTASVVFLPKDYQSEKQLLELRDQAYRKFYIRPKYWWLKVRSINSSEDFLRYWRGLVFLLEVRLLRRGENY
ncbi:cobalamin B12-binding domain-containing protein [Candidatus Woesearchaeota archaeon]|nr:cobalamin B12-binding domain-containing protein [Candidatus Woesearchaeota archaeon]